MDFRRAQYIRKVIAKKNISEIRELSKEELVDYIYYWGIEPTPTEELMRSLLKE